MFYRCLLNPFVPLHVNSLVSVLRFFLVDLFIGERGMLKSPTISVWGLMCDLSSSSVYFAYVGVFILGA